MPRQALTQVVTASLPARGRYIFRGAEIYSGDFLACGNWVTASGWPRKSWFSPAADLPELEDTLGGFFRRNVGISASFWKTLS